MTVQVVEAPPPSAQATEPAMSAQVAEPPLLTAVVVEGRIIVAAAGP